MLSQFLADEGVEDEGEEGEEEEDEDEEGEDEEEDGLAAIYKDNLDVSLTDWAHDQHLTWWITVC